MLHLTEDSREGLIRGVLGVDLREAVAMWQECGEDPSSCGNSCQNNLRVDLPKEVAKQFDGIGWTNRTICSVLQRLDYQIMAKTENAWLAPDLDGGSKEPTG